jgi:hypothetical protein
MVKKTAIQQLEKLVSVPEIQSEVQLQPQQSIELPEFFEVKINNVIYKCKAAGLKSFAIYTQISNKGTEIETLEDTITMFYSVLKARNPEFPLSYNDFGVWIEDHTDEYERFFNFIADKKKIV